MLFECFVDLIKIDPQHFRQDAYIHHVFDIAYQFWRNIGFFGQLIDRHRVQDNIVTTSRLGDVIRIEKDTSRYQSRKILFEGQRIHGHNNLVFFLSGQKTVFINTNGIPGGLTLNIGWKNILPGYRDPHAEKRSHDGGIGSGAA